MTSGVHSVQPRPPQRDSFRYHQRDAQTGAATSGRQHSRAPLGEIGDLSAWVAATRALPCTGPLPTRLVLTPNERVAHALRRQAVTSGALAVLAGTRFLTPVALSLEVLALSEVQRTTDGAALAPELLAEILASQTLNLETLHQKELAEIAGWDRALARTIAELEGDALQPDMLLRSDDGVTRDVGRIWHALRQALGSRWFTGRTLQAAAERITKAPTLLGDTPVLAVVTGEESASLAHFIRALPNVTLAAWSTRPRDDRWQQRLSALLGPPPSSSADAGSATARNAIALTRVKAHLLTDTLPHAPATGDDSVEIATFSGIVDEVEAAVYWAAEQISRGTPAQEIALLATDDSYAPLLMDALGALPWPEDCLPAIAVSGRPLTDRADGARLGLLLHALHHNLPREAVARVLAIAKDAAGEPVMRGLSATIGLVAQIPSLGGSAAHPQGALTWTAAHARALAALGVPDTEDNPARARDITNAREGLTRLGDALAALQALAALVTQDAAAAVLWPAIRDFAERWLRLPTGGAPAVALLEAELRPWLAAEKDGPRGHSALERFVEVLIDLRVRNGRYGQPGIYVGSLHSALMLPFTAVRILGLAEGTVPSNPRQDAVLDDARRTALSSTLPTTTDRTRRQLAALHGAIRETGERLALSAPREGIDGGQRQPAAVLLDVMACLEGTFHAVEDRLERAADAGRARWRARTMRAPLTESAWLRRAALRAGSAPHWVDDSCGGAPVAAVAYRREPDGHDGLCAGVAPTEQLPGLSPDRPISASRLGTLVQCPHRFALEHLLHFRQPSTLPSSAAIDPMPFGTLLHDVAEDFARRYGLAFSAREGTPEPWLEHGRLLADAHFDALMDSFPLASDAVRAAARAALYAQLEKLLHYDWSQSCEFVAAEQPFGYGDGLAIDTEVGALYLHGSIDRLDVRDGRALVRDLKTGRSKPRKSADPPEPSIDLQVGVYAIVASAMAEVWGTPAEVDAGYVYLKSGSLERRWDGEDATKLATHTQQWLATAREVLTSGAFVRSTDTADCQYCAFVPVCDLEEGRHEAAMRHPDVPHRLRVLKGAVPAVEGEDGSEADDD